MELNKPNHLSPKDLQHWESYDNYTLKNPHVGVCIQYIDLRFIIT